MSIPKQVITPHISQQTQKRPKPDVVLVKIADYACDFTIDSAHAYQTARWCLMDALACALMALDFPACTRLLGPLVPGATLTGGARVPGTSYQLDPAQAAFNIGCLIRWLDFNDTWLAAEWGHPSDNLGSILAVTDYLSRQRIIAQKPPIIMQDILTAMIKSYEIQGILALENSFNWRGLDHVLLVRVASTAVITKLLGGEHKQIMNALSNAWMDGGALRAYRHAPNTGSRKSWAAGDACRRAVQLALMAMQGEMGYPTVLTEKAWGFYDVLFDCKPFKLAQGFDSYVIENILFKIAYPAEFHAQTAVEAALQLHPKVKNKIRQIDCIEVETQQPAMRIINKPGQLDNPADRDHCLQYLVAVPLIFGHLRAENYEDQFARDARIDQLRRLIQIRENKQFTQDYFDPQKRSISNAVQIFFKDGSSTEKVVVQFPIGHRKRRSEAIPLLQDKFEQSLASRLPAEKTSTIKQLFNSQSELAQTPVHEFMNLFVV